MARGGSTRHRAGATAPGLALMAIAAAVLVGCPGAPPPPPAAGPPAPPAAAPVLAAAGGPCRADGECESAVCEGQGCGADQPGICAERVRPCTRDLRRYCGCDGVTFEASGSCPGRRYAQPGACAVARTEGEACTENADCDSGLCEGEGCGPEQGRCAPRMRGCTRDLAPYCGCDGVTFRTSGSCPGRRFAHRGPC